MFSMFYITGAVTKLRKYAPKYKKAGDIDKHSKIKPASSRKKACYNNK